VLEEAAQALGPVAGNRLRHWTYARAVRPDVRSSAKRPTPRNEKNPAALRQTRPDIALQTSPWGEFFVVAIATNVKDQTAL